MLNSYAARRFYAPDVLNSCRFMSVNKAVMLTGYESRQHYVAFSIVCLVSTKTLKCKSALVLYATMADNKSETGEVEVRQNGEKAALVRYSNAAGLSVEVGPSFDSCVRIWFDRMSDTGSVYKDDKHVAEIRSGILLGVRMASEAAMWEAKTGVVSSLTDGRDENGVAFVEVCDNE